MRLDLRVIRYAHALAEHGSFSRAAEVLGIRQPTLSEAISELEKQIGEPLFVRGRGRVQPTDFGHLFLGQASRVVAEVSDLEREIVLAKGLESGVVTVLFGAYAAAHLVRPLIRKFASAHPRVQLRTQVFSTSEEASRAAHGRVCDLLVAEVGYFQDDPSLTIEWRLPSVSGCAIVRAGHPLTQRKAFSPADLLDYPFVQVTRFPHRILRELLAQRRPAQPRETGRTIPFPAIDVPSVRDAIDVVVDSDAFMLASLTNVKHELEQGLVVPVFGEPWIRTDWGIFRLSTRSPGPAVSEAIAELRRIGAAIAAEEAHLATRYLRAGQPTVRRKAVARAGSRRRT